MANFRFDKATSDEESRIAKNEIRGFYRWKYGYAPPADWQIDHQVEQMIPMYERFGPKRIHSIANLIMVPPELNHAKNLAYNQTWEFAPPGFRHVLAPVDDSRRFGDTRPQRIRELIFKRSVFMKDPDEAWYFLTEFSRHVLMALIQRLSEEVWTKTPPNWIKVNDLWVNRLKDDVCFHTIFINQYLRAKARRLAEAQQQTG